MPAPGEDEWKVRMRLYRPSERRIKATILRTGGSSGPSPPDGSGTLRRSVAARPFRATRFHRVPAVARVCKLARRRSRAPAND